MKDKGAWDEGAERETNQKAQTDVLPKSIFDFLNEVLSFIRA